MRDALASVDVIILAGGRGTRLGSLPADVPKPLRPVAGRPFITYLIEQVRACGAHGIILALAHRHEEFRGIEGVRVSVEPEPLGTGGALRHALPHVSTPAVLVMNGDSYADADLGALVARHHAAPALVTILLTQVDDTSRFGRVETHASGAVTGFLEKGRSGPGQINAGVYVMERTVIESIPGGRAVSLEREVLPALVGQRFVALAGRFPFIDIGTPETYRSADEFFRKRRNA